MVYMKYQCEEGSVDMEKVLYLLPLCLLLMVVLFTAAPTVHAADIGVDITIEFPETVKVGQTWGDIEPEITVQCSSTRYSFTVGTAPEDVQFASNSQAFVQKNNFVYVSFNLYVQGLKEPMVPSNLLFTINGEEYPREQIFFQQGENGAYLRFESYAFSLDLTDRATYTISPDGKDYTGFYISLYDMPEEAEAGVNIPFNADFYSISGTSFCPYNVDNYTFNGTPINSGETFTMPAANVTIGASLTDMYKDHAYLTNVDVVLDFEDPEIYYGKRLPTLSEFSDALNVTYNVPGLPIVYRFKEIAHFNEGAPWPGNIMLSFQVEAPEGYLFANPYLKEFDTDENGNEILPLENWFNENLCVTFNGIETFFRRDPEDNYANGYFVSGFFGSPDTLEIHIFWFVAEELDLDLSGYKAGDFVTIPDYEWRWDGYMPTCYQLQYIGEYGETVTEFLSNFFIMPKATGDVKLYVNMVRGSYKAEGGALLGVPDVIPIQIQKMKDDDCGGMYYEICDLANTVLNDQKVTFNKLDTSNGVFLEVVFPVDKDFDAMFIAFYRLTGEYCGFWEVVPALVDPETGLCHAIISHDGPPTIDHTYDNPGDTVCSVCGYGKGSSDSSDDNSGNDDQNNNQNGGNTITEKDGGYFKNLFKLFINWIRSFIDWIRSLFG